MKDKQPRRPSKANASLDQLHPPSAMDKRAKGGDKFANPTVGKRNRGTDETAMKNNDKKAR